MHVAYLGHCSINVTSLAVNDDKNDKSDITIANSLFYIKIF